MNYQLIYNKIIDRRKKEPYNGYTEIHHIIPRALGGMDNSDNLIKLSAREHYICHYLLMKIYKPGTFNGNKMLKAFVMMMYCKSDNQERYVSSRRYEMLKQHFSKIQSESQSGVKNSQHGSMWISNIELRQTKRIKNYEVIPEGWIKKRIVDFDSYLKPDTKSTNCKTNKTNKTNKRIQQHIEWYEIYKEVGFDEFVKIGRAHV